MRSFIQTVSLLLFLVVGMQVQAQQLQIKINPALAQRTEQLVQQFDAISEERKTALREIADFLLEKRGSASPYGVLFVCTHNSRRSHLSDLWFKYGTLFFGIEGFASYSGGMEATAFNPNAIAAVERAGFNAAFSRAVKNPVVSVTPGNYPVWQMQSKKFTHEMNPKDNFVAVMVCSDADRSCPLVPGADTRFAIPYNDPRHYDQTPAQNLKYDEALNTIGREMLYLTDYLKKQLILYAARASK